MIEHPDITRIEATGYPYEYECDPDWGTEYEDSCYEDRRDSGLMED